MLRMHSDDKRNKFASMVSYIYLLFFFLSRSFLNTRLDLRFEVYKCGLLIPNASPLWQFAVSRYIKIDKTGSKLRITETIEREGKKLILFWVNNQQKNTKTTISILDVIFYLIDIEGYLLLTKMGGDVGSIIDLLPNIQTNVAAVTFITTQIN